MFKAELNFQTPVLATWRETANGNLNLKKNPSKFDLKNIHALFQLDGTKQDSSCTGMILCPIGGFVE